ncbi:cytosolic protein [bacterium]|nr:cytosolic protein [bacterium]
MAECVNKSKNLENCGCTYPSCSKKGMCCECLKSHWKNRELPGCLFPPEAEKTYNRSLEYFIEVWRKKLGI